MKELKEEKEIESNNMKDYARESRREFIDEVTGKTPMWVWIVLVGLILMVLVGNIDLSCLNLK